MLSKSETDYPGADLSAFFELMKPRVMRLVVFTTVVGMVASQEFIHPVIAIASVIFIGLGAGAAGALNMWWDSDIDFVMARTDKRPIPSGKVKPEDALYFGLFLSVLSVMMLGLIANFLAAFILGFTIWFYIFIYSIWLKRATPQNIVIGGAAGAFPPVIGWVATSGNIGFGSILLFLLIFIWTPPHFWALSLFSHSDYHRANVPMLNVTHGKPHTRLQILLYTLVLTLISVGISFSSLGGIFYFISALILNAYLLYLAIRVYYQTEQVSQGLKMKYEKKLFLFSISYLFVLFSMILLEALIDRFQIASVNFQLTSIFF
jgi:protoheme IX farnesyltransferase